MGKDNKWDGVEPVLTGFDKDEFHLVPFIYAWTWREEKTDAVERVPTGAERSLTNGIIMRRMAQYLGSLGMVAWLATASAQGAELVRLAHYGFENDPQDTTGQHASAEKREKSARNSKLRWHPEPGCPQLRRVEVARVAETSGHDRPAQPAAGGDTRAPAAPLLRSSELGGLASTPAGGAWSKL